MNIVILWCIGRSESERILAVCKSSTCTLLYAKRDSNTYIAVITIFKINFTITAAAYSSSTGCRYYFPLFITHLLVILHEPWLVHRHTIHCKSCTVREKYRITLIRFISRTVTSFGLKCFIFLINCSNLQRGKLKITLFFLNYVIILSLYYGLDIYIYLYCATRSIVDNDLLQSLHYVIMLCREKTVNNG